VGGFEQALNKLGGTCVMASEIDKFANQSYELLYGHETVGDITKVEAQDVPDHDVLVGGFPCQSFSVAGKRGGFDDARGTLFFEIARLAKVKQPKAMLLENVKGLISHDKGKTLDTIVTTLNQLGYRVDFDVLNSKYFGVPQNRERIFIVAVRDDLIEPQAWAIKGTNVVAKGKRRISQLPGIKTFNFDWPEQTEVTTRLRDILEDNVDERYYLSEEKTAKLVTQLEEKRYSDVRATLTPEREEKRQNGRRFKETDEPAFTLNTQDRHGVTLSEPQMLGHIDLKGHDAIKRVYSAEGVSPTLTTMGGGHREPKIAERGDEIASEKERNTFKILRELWEEVGEETIAEWRFRVLNSLQQTEVLRQKLYGEFIQREGANGQSKLVHGSQTSESDKESGNMREVWVGSECRYTPQGRKLEEQFARELASIMSELSYEGAQTEKELQDLWESTQGFRVLREALYKIQEIWRSELPKTRYRIRKLTPRETFRLQGFPDEAYEVLSANGVSNSQLYKQAGNAVTVNVIDAIGRRLLPLIEEVGQ
jgi:DNA (cytosine-5)-methyltransferase 1